MKKYNELRELVYNIIHPDGIPLEFGCEVNYLGVIMAITEIENDEYVRVVSGGSLWKKELFVNNHKILGKPLSLQDVLRAIGIPYNDLYISWGKYMLFHDSREDMKRIEGIQIDLTKPISSQSEEVLDKLIELIK